MRTPPDADRRDLRSDTRGAVAIEYALIALFVAMAIVASLPLVGSSLSSIFNRAQAGLATTAR